MDQDNLLQNFDCPPIHTRHEKLLAAGQGLARECPLCGGIITLRRDVETLQLLDYDRCLLCGQLYIFDDADQIESRGVAQR